MLIEAVGVMLRLAGIVADAPNKPYLMEAPGVPAVIVKLPAVMFVGLVVEDAACDDNKMMFPAVLPAGFGPALVFILPTLITLALAPPAEMNTDPPIAVLLLKLLTDMADTLPRLT